MDLLEVYFLLLLYLKYHNLRHRQSHHHHQEKIHKHNQILRLQLRLLLKMLMGFQVLQVLQEYYLFLAHQLLLLLQQVV